MTAGPDGNLWFTETNGNIGRITPAGVITEFQTDVAPLSDITTGPDGNLWFIGTSTVGRITPTGAITSYQAQTVGGGPEYIITGPDGNLWFTETGGDKMGRIIP